MAEALQQGHGGTDEHPSIFALADAAAERGLLEAVRARFRLGRERSENAALTAWDTFDWRVRRHGGALWTIDGDPPTAIWRRSDGETLGRAELAGDPDFAWNLPAGLAGLGDALSVRRLLPMFDLTLTTRTLPVLGPEDKTVARVVFERGTVTPRGGGRRRRLPSSVLVLPVRGYPTEAADLSALLAGLELAPLPAALLDRAIEAAADALPPREAAKRPPIDADDPAGVAVARILRGALEAMQRNEEGLRQDLDSEFLHDFRVAVRRSRAIQGQLRSVFRPGTLTPFRKEFKWLGALTGPLRDLDVWLLRLDRDRELLPPSERDALDPLARQIAALQRQEHARLVQGLESDRYATLIAGWRRFLAGAEKGKFLSDTGRLPVLQVASARILKRYERVLRDGRRIGEDTPADALHELRIDGKKLRYQLEFFTPLYPADQIRPLVRALKRLQDLLGDFNDLEVQQDRLSSLAERLSKSGEAPVRTLLAMGRLIEILHGRQVALREDFAERFAPLDGDEVHARVRQLFGGKTDEAAACE